MRLVVTALLWRLFSLSLLLHCGRAVVAFVPPPSVTAPPARNALTVMAAACSPASSPSKILESPSAERNKDPIWKVLRDTFVLPWTERSASIDNSESGMPKILSVLEVSAGCGVHTLHFATNIIETFNINHKESFQLYYIPSDPDHASRQSIDARIKSQGSHIIVNSSSIHPAVSLTLAQDGIQESDTISLLNTFLQQKQGTTAASNDDNSFVLQRQMTTREEDSFELMLCINMIHISSWSATIGLMKLAQRKLSSQDGILYCYGPFLEHGTSVPTNLDFDAMLKFQDPSWGVRNLEDVVNLANENCLYLIKKVEMPANNLSLLFARKREKEHEI